MGSEAVARLERNSEVDGETTASGWQAECGGEHGGAQMSGREINVVGPERRGHAGV
jgi:hypothetical protein